MPLTTIKLPGRKPRAQELYEFLRTAILDGRLDPSERLVEMEIARLSSVSRTPVREAIRKLEADGLIEQTTVGVRVVPVSAATLRELCEVREHLEGMACRAAAVGRSEMDLRQLERLADAFDESLNSGDLNAIVLFNHRFHETIWHMSGNSYLASFLGDLRQRIEGLQGTTLVDVSRQRRASVEHREFLRLLRDRDEVAAEALARLHFREAMALRLAMSGSNSTVPNAGLAD